ncbi:hypothetical protein CXG81DRAFT_25829 [Caulochytrium protostelioides]|uniref:Uncharacterized protein n=1 Tax=Caulochytrium protostelioides TaxID=1555241 RepID=A0A4P9X939_9FUNG|nr:hypothetical protein CXG81DRAFT_25829 [Caulochytrium protostelioides]|eukprot:RKP01501.1 hypothetical protein CXG81DRAFT_25829 [Caulochytrium protostelioides]
MVFHYLVIANTEGVVRFLRDWRPHLRAAGLLDLASTTAIPAPVIHHATAAAAASPPPAAAPEWNGDPARASHEPRDDLDEATLRALVTHNKAADPSQSFVIFFEGERIVRRRFGSLWFLLAVSDDEFLLAWMETLGQRHGITAEIDFVLSLDKVHLGLDDMVCNGQFHEQCPLTFVN